MNSWYNIVGLDERSNEQCDGIDESRQRVTQILIDEHNRTKLPYSRMVLAGFSQGGALSLFTGLQFNHPLAGIVVLSGYLPCAQRFRIAPGLESTPIFHGQYVCFWQTHRTQDVSPPFHVCRLGFFTSPSFFSHHTFCFLQWHARYDCQLWDGSKNPCIVVGTGHSTIQLENVQHRTHRLERRNWTFD